MCWHAGVFAGILLGVAMRPANLGPQGLDLLGFPGDVMLRLLKMMVLPLIAGSMIAGDSRLQDLNFLELTQFSNSLTCEISSDWPQRPGSAGLSWRHHAAPDEDHAFVFETPGTGVCSLRGNAQSVADTAMHTVLYYPGTTDLHYLHLMGVLAQHSKHDDWTIPSTPEALTGPFCTGVCSLRGNTQGVADMAKYTVLYYAGTTALSVCLGIALVSVIFPGRGHPLSAASMHGNCHHTAVPQVTHLEPPIISG